MVIYRMTDLSEEHVSDTDHHIWDHEWNDVQVYGMLDDIYSFIFESYMRIISGCHKEECVSGEVV